MRFQTSKNRPKFAFEHGGFSQRQSHIVSYMIKQLYSMFVHTELRINLYVHVCVHVNCVHKCVCMHVCVCLCVICKDVYVLYT